MTLEEIKERRAELVEHELDSDIMEMFCWMIAEIERLRAELDSVHDYYTGALERNVEETARRCADLANNHCVCVDFANFSSVCNTEESIRKEFGLEDR